jgi:hypothetical protein
MRSSPTSERLTPPRGGRPPPTEARLADGEVVWLRPVAEEVAGRFYREYPDERDRYGEAGFQWCVHDNQYLVYWASLSQDVFAHQLEWLAGLLEARTYPLGRLARDLEVAADVVEERWGERAAAPAAILRAGAASVREA